MRVFSQKKNYWVSLFVVCFVLSSPAHAGYKKILKNWTRSDRVYLTHNMDAAILWKATPVNDEVLGAQIEEYARIYEPSDAVEYANERRQHQGKDSLFFVSFYSGNRPFEDLTNARADWELRLKMGGEVYAPLRFEKIKKHSPLDLRFYPYLNQWSHGYYVWFPRIHDKNFSLSVRSPYARSELHW